MSAVHLDSNVSHYGRYFQSGASLRLAGNKRDRLGAGAGAGGLAAMRMVIQRVSSASVRIEEAEERSIGAGVVVLVAVEEGDAASDAAWLADKVVRLRIFSGEEDGRMSRSLLDIGGEALVVSQFTLLGVLRKGTRPSYHRSAVPETAVPLYETFIAELEKKLGRPVCAGEFGARMQVDLTNDGPVTLVVDSRRKEV